MQALPIVAARHMHIEQQSHYKSPVTLLQLTSIATAWRGRNLKAGAPDWLKPPWLGCKFYHALQHPLRRSKPCLSHRPVSAVSLSFALPDLEHPVRYIAMHGVTKPSPTEVLTLPREGRCCR